MTLPLFAHESGNAAASAIELAERTALYATSTICEKCGERILDVDEAVMVRRADGDRVLIHWTQLCFDKEIEAMIQRYISQPRVKWTERAE